MHHTMKHLNPDLPDSSWKDENFKAQTQKVPQYGIRAS
jgi:hypothetical protein